MRDLIDRQQAIDALAKHEKSKGHNYTLFVDIVSECAEIIRDLPFAEPEPQWVSVQERIPEYGVEVLTINVDGEYEINHIIDEEDAEWFFNGATAWMPLPEVYKGGA